MFFLSFFKEMPAAAAAAILLLLLVLLATTTPRTAERDRETYEEVADAVASTAYENAEEADDRARSVVGFEPIPPNFATTLAARQGGLAAHLSRHAVPRHGYAPVESWIRRGGGAKVFERILSASAGSLAAFDRTTYLVVRGWGDATGAVARELDANIAKLEEHLQRGAKTFGVSALLGALQKFSKKTYDDVRALGFIQTNAHGFSDTLSSDDMWVFLRVTRPATVTAASLTGALLHELAHVVTDAARDPLRYDRAGHDEAFVRNLFYIQKHARAAGIAQTGHLPTESDDSRVFYSLENNDVAASPTVTLADWDPAAQKTTGILAASALPENLRVFLACTTLPRAAALAKGAREFGGAMEHANGPNWLADLRAAEKAWRERGE